jgi:hypothetical protein
MAGVKFDQSQIRAGVAKCRAQAIKVHVSEAISEGDILCIVGTESGFISVGIADANVTTKRDGPMFVADYAAAAGAFSPVAVPWKVFTTTLTASAVNDRVFLTDTGTTGNTLGSSAGTATVAVGRFLDTTSGASVALLYPGAGVQST